MIGGIFHPLTIFLLGLGGGFAIPLSYRLGKGWLAGLFALSLLGIAATSAVLFVLAWRSGQPFELMTGGAAPPIAINLRFGPWEGFCALGVNVVAVLGAWQLWDRLRGSYASLLLFLILVMGINGMVMTRDLFNLFVFLEIVSIATYGLLGLGASPAAVAAAFKYIMATVIASALFLLGAVLVYHAAGTLNIDDLIAHRQDLSGPLAQTALCMLLACLIVELKPFPANGWGLDVYETAPAGVAALLSVGVSAGVFFALVKLLPLFADQLGIAALSGGITFLFANLTALAQGRVQRLLGYSSVGQMGLLVMAVALLDRDGADAAIPLIAGGLFVNHLLAKAGLFWFAGAFGLHDAAQSGAAARRPFAVLILAVFIVAIAGLPPFPGFWAKWALIMQLAAANQGGWIALVLAGSLLEAAYLFRWFGRVLSGTNSAEDAPFPGWAAVLPAAAAAALLAVTGYAFARLSGAGQAWSLIPLAAGLLLLALDRLPPRMQGALALVVVACAGLPQAAAAGGIAALFAALLLPGGLVIALASLYRADARPGHYPLLAVLLLSILTLLRAATSLDFFFSWELVTLASYFLIARSPRSRPFALQFLLFSLGSAAFILAGFSAIAAAGGGTDLAAFAELGAQATTGFALLAVGFLIKAAAIGVHVWLPGAYAEADDDLSAMLSGVVSKVAVMGLLIGTYLALRSAVALDVAHLIAWIGMLTTMVGALIAAGQSDLKRLLAFSSMSQLGYIVTAIALMSHLGWVTAVYLVANHMLVKGILFLAAAGIILRTGTRSLEATGGLRHAMPITFGMVLVAVVAMSGLPPLMGFGGKWLLLSAMTDKGWYLLAVAGLVATFLGFVYMIRLVAALFFGEPSPAHRATGEAPLILLVSQGLLVVGILVLSFFPKLLMDPVSAAIDPQFASTLVWQGMSLETIYGYWNPLPVAVVAVAAALLLFCLLWLGYRHAQAGARSVARFYSYYRPALPPLAEAGWGRLEGGVAAVSATLRKVYTGNGQTYALYVLFYFLAVYALNELQSAVR